MSTGKLFEKEVTVGVHGGAAFFYEGTGCSAKAINLVSKSPNDIVVKDEELLKQNGRKVKVTGTRVGPTVYVESWQAA